MKEKKEKCALISWTKASLLHVSFPIVLATFQANIGIGLYIEVYTRLLKKKAIGPTQ